MRPDPTSEAARWFRQTAQDLDDARYALSGGRFHLACFPAQQGAEKALEAAIYGRGADRVWGHSVAGLCEDPATRAPGA